MTKTKMYKYKSEEGYIITPIEIKTEEPAPFFYRIVADNKKILTNGKVRKIMVEVFEEEVSLWQEVDKNQEELELEQNFYFSNNEDNSEIDYKELLDIVTGNE